MVFVAPYALFLAAVFACPFGFAVWMSFHDFLRAQVTPPAQPGHTTYELADRPSIGVLWTYSEPRPDGTWTRVGGGPFDPATDTWGQGAYNADDVSRAAAVYLRHWRQTGSAASRAAAFELLRGLTYLQTATGPNRGNVVLWMQPDGTAFRAAGHRPAARQRRLDGVVAAYRMTDLRTRGRGLPAGALSGRRR